jgi:hypothetical protein
MIAAGRGATTVAWVERNEFDRNTIVVRPGST